VTIASTRNVAMTRLIVLGATGSLGRHVLRRALAAGHDVSVFVRTPSRLPPDVVRRVTIHTGDLADGLPVELMRGKDALVNCAGYVADGARFVGLVDRVVTSVEALPAAERPVCWFLAGVALLDIDASGRRGVALPKIKSTYWAHQANFERLSRSPLDWRLLCPGPMVDEPAIGLHRMRTSLDTLPVRTPRIAGCLPGPLLVPVFASLIPQMIIPYADAAELMLAYLGRGDAMSRHRVGMALPMGMRGEKTRWSAPAGAAARER